MSPKAREMRHALVDGAMDKEHAKERAAPSAEEVPTQAKSRLEWATQPTMEILS